MHCYGCEIPEDLHYHPDYDCWVRFEGDDTATMGMTDIAQTLAGQLLFVRFKSPGRKITAGRIAATIESGKWIGPFKMPFDVELLAVNDDAFSKDILAANKDPYGAGWLVKVRLLHPEAAHTDLLSGAEAADFYRRKIEENDIRCYRCVE